MTNTFITIFSNN